VTRKQVRHEPSTPEIVEFLIRTPLDVLDLVDEVRRLRENEWRLRARASSLALCSQTCSTKPALLLQYGAIADLYQVTEAA
jgi:hypothetical protein